MRNTTMHIHRCRFAEYEPRAINSVAFSHSSVPFKGKHSRTVPARLAIGRANGDIEIWNPMGGRWLQEMRIMGGRGRTIESLTWVVGEDEEVDGGKAMAYGQMRLFSIGDTNTITEWDLENACAKRHASGQHGNIWCLGTQPSLPAGSTLAGKSQHPRLVGGTVDGCLALYTTEDDDLRFQRLLRTHKKRVNIVSIAFQSRNIAVVGCSDSTIRVFDLRSGTIKHAMSLGRDLISGSKDIIAWTVRCLPNGDIVSGDSTGQICIWDGQTYTQAQRIQGHKQDILSLTTSPDGSSIVSGGMDQRVVMYQPLTGRPGRWGKFWSRKYHDHDVRTMASFEARGISVVVSGGPDAVPIVLPLEKSGMHNHRALSHLPQAVPVASAPKALMMMVWMENMMGFWTFDQTYDTVMPQDTNFLSDASHNKHYVAEITVSGDAHISSAAISSDGSLVVAVTSAEVKAFHLQKTDGKFTISKLRIPTTVASKGASKVTISPDDRWIALAHGTSNDLTVLEVIPPTDTAKTTFSPQPKLRRLKRSIPRYKLLSGLGQYDRHTTQMAFSPNSRMLATADLAGYIDTWVLRTPEEIGGAEEEENDSSDSSSSEDEDGINNKKGTSNTTTERWIRNPLARQLPKLDATPVVLSFSPDVPGQPAVTGANEEPVALDYVLLAITAASRVLAFNPLRARLAPWFRRLSPHNLPVEYRDILDHAKGVLWQGPRAWIYGSSFLFMIDTSVDADSEGPETQLVSASKHSADEEEGQPPGKRRRKRYRGNDTGAGGEMQESWLEPRRVQLAVAAGEGKSNGITTTDGATTGKEWVDIEMKDRLHNKRSRHDRAENNHIADSDEEDEEDEDDNDDDDDNDYAVNGEDSRDRQASQQQLQREHLQQAVSEVQRRQTTAGQQETQERRRWWISFKYRPILGMVPLAACERISSNGESSSLSSASSFDYSSLEVALVERPEWDLDLPVQYDADE